jgi:vacuolar-type H+-ATPase subunit D/Vma8
MSEVETTAVERLKEIQSEYSHLCTKAGQLQYQIFAMSDELKEMNRKIKDLNNEAYGLKLEQVQGEQGEVNGH